METMYIAMALVVFGLILVLAEATMPGGYLLIPGIDMLVIGAYAILFPDYLYTWVTPVVAAVLTVPVVIGTLMLYRRLGKTEPPSTTVTGSLIGKTGKVTVDTVPGNIKGKVKIGSDVWSASSDIPLPVGTEVVVDSAEGVHVHVKKL